MIEFSKSILGSLRKIIFGMYVLLPLVYFLFLTGAKIDRDPMVLTFEFSLAHLAKNRLKNRFCPKMRAIKLMTNSFLCRGRMMDVVGTL